METKRVNGNKSLVSNWATAGRAPGREMVRRVGEHRHNLVLPSLGSLPVSSGMSRSLSLHLCVPKHPSSMCVGNSLLFQLCFLCSHHYLFVAIAVLPEGLDAQRSSLWPRLWHWQWCWHRGEASEMSIEAGREGAEACRLSLFMVNSGFQLICSSLLSTTEQALLRNERPM